MANKKGLISKLTQAQIDNKKAFVDSYINAYNNSDASLVDANANVSSKNVATLAGEFYKDFNVQFKRCMVTDHIKTLYGEELAQEYNRQIEKHEIYIHDESNPFTYYCAAVSLYPFLLNGLKDLGGESLPPKHLVSFCGSFINLAFALSSQLAGACLYKDQKVVINGKNIKIKDFVSSFDLNKSFESDGQIWEYTDLPEGYFIAEDGRNVKLTKVYRRKYNDYIYEITTKRGLKTRTSKDHRFKQDINGKEIETRVEDLEIGDTVCSNTDLSYIDDVSNIDFAKKPFKGNDIIVAIKVFDNDDDYVYEVETESHWYNCGGLITHNCATVEFLMYFDYFARKDYGDDYLEKHPDIIEACFQQVVYSLNMPASARCYQSIFWNISIFDKYYFDALFSEFVFPDSNDAKPDYNSLKKLQEFFMTWFNKERTRAVLTFPVVTAAMLTDGNGKAKDEEFKTMLCKELSEGNSFFIYMSDSAASLSSCCRLQSQVEENVFSYSLGAGGVSTGSMNVITLNVNRFVQNLVKKDGNANNLESALKEQIEKIHKYQIATKDYLETYNKAGLMPIYSAGYISTKKQFLTIGINGLLESAEFLGYEISDNEDYKKYIARVLKVIYDTNKEGRITYKQRFNTELVPAENLGVKNYNWDKRDGYVVSDSRFCYNSYLYKVEDTEIDIVDKFILHGGDNLKYLDGGSALHLNLEEYPTAEAYSKLFDLAGKTGCNYWTTNVKITICEDCGNIDKNTLTECPKCHSKNVSYATRIIGYLKKIDSFSEERRKEESLRFYDKAV